MTTTLNYEFWGKKGESVWVDSGKKSEKKDRVNKPGRAGMAQEAIGLGIFSTSTRHIR